MKRAIILGLVIVASCFALDWGVYGGPGMSFSMTNMKPVHDEISRDAASEDPNFPGYDVGSFASYQLGLRTPIIIRFFDFTVGWGDSYSWQTFKGNDWKTSFQHRLEITEFGYIINLGDNLRLRPVVGLGDYDIDMTIAELGGGFGDPQDETDAISRSYDYHNFSMTAGASIAYLWKFDNNVVIGVEGSLRYLIPFENEDTWDSDGFYQDAVISDFYPHTPVAGINFLIGYERIGEEDRLWEGEWDDDWEEK